MESHANNPPRSTTITTPIHPFGRSIQKTSATYSRIDLKPGLLVWTINLYLNLDNAVWHSLSRWYENWNASFQGNESISIEKKMAIRAIRKKWNCSSKWARCSRAIREPIQFLSKLHISPIFLYINLAMMIRKVNKHDSKSWSSENWDPEVEQMNLAHILSHEYAHFTTHTDSQQWTERICETLSLTVTRQWPVTRLSGKLSILYNP